VVNPNSPPPLPPGVVVPPSAPRPALPPEWLVRAAQKLQNPGRRRGLLLLATGLVITALFLFAPGRAYRRKPGDRA